MNDSRLLTRICLISLTVASWVFTVSMVILVVGALIIGSQVSETLDHLTSAAEQLAETSSGLAATLEDLTTGPNVVTNVVELIAALVELFRGD